MIEDLKILNGDLELAFNEYTYFYTVKVASDIEALEFDYKLEPDCYVKIRDNSLKYGDNTVYVDVYNVDKTITYTFSVYKEDLEQVNGIDDYKKSLEVVNIETVDVYKVQTLAISIFLILIIIFTLLFKKKRSK